MMFAFVLLIALETGETFRFVYDTRDECVSRLLSARPVNNFSRGLCVQVPWRKA